MINSFSHPLVLPGAVQTREYQLAISKRALNENSLVILPTGLGKTVIALIVMAKRITGEQKCILVAPTKPLCEQHFNYFSRMLPFTSVRILTGELSGPDRLKEWNDAQVVIATPQTIENDLKSGTYDFSGVSLLVIDEAHRAVGGYAYTYLASEYQRTSQDPLILAMTASPGGNEEKVNSIKEALFISQVLSKTETDPDVAPYLHEKEIDRIYLDLPDVLRVASVTFQDVMKDRIQTIRKMGIKFPLSPGMKDLNRLKTEANNLISQKNGSGFALAAIHAELMKLKHAILITETQGLLPLMKYLDKLNDECIQEKPVKSSKNIMSDPGVYTLYKDILDDEQGEIHPKAIRLPAIIQGQLKKNPDGKILVFASYRDTGKYISEILNQNGIKCSVFTGQGKRGNEKGMNQKKQQETIQKFREGEFQVLVATSVAEEGLDIPACNVVIFYEPVPSEIRSIQRRGRTGRFASGLVVVLVTRDTIDETNLFISQRKEEKMRTGVTGMMEQRAIV